MRYDVCIELAPASVAAPAASTGDGAAWEAERTRRVLLARAWAPDLPGCFCEAPSVVRALDRMPAVIAEYQAWLRRHGEDAPGGDAVEVHLAEVIETPVREPSFAADRTPASVADIELAIRRMGYARNDLLATIAELPPAVLDWQPAPEKWSIRQSLEHIASGDGYYRQALLEREPEREPEHERFDLALQRERAIAHLRSLTEEQRSPAFRPDWPWRGDNEEEWTVRKVLRRFIYHERFHTSDIQQTLAWLLAGAPEEHAIRVEPREAVSSPAETGP